MLLNRTFDESSGGLNRSLYKWPIRIVIILAVAALTVVLFKEQIRTRVRSMAFDAGFANGIDALHMAEYTYTGHILSDIPFALRNWVASLTPAAQVPPLVLEIKLKHLNKLRKRRTEALRVGLLIQQKDDFVPASIRLRDRTVRVKLRLKGDLTFNQFDDKTWSFRVEVKGDDHLFGMRRFNLQPASARDYHAEPLFLEHVRSLGILAPRYRFVRVALNGENLGVMAVEEHFSRELLEPQGRREGVLLKIDESRFWVIQDARARFSGPLNNFMAGDFKAFRQKRIRRHPRLADDYRVAVGLYRAFVEGNLKPSEVFDARLMGRYLAICDSWHAWHGASWRNMRFYFNPITARLEPIAYDAELLHTEWRTPEPLHGVLVADPAIRRHYDATLKAIADGDPDSFPLAHLEAAQKRYLARLHHFVPFLTALDFSAIRSRATEMLKQDITDRIRYEPNRYEKEPPPEINPGDYPPGAVVRAHIVSERQGRKLELSNLVPFPVSVSVPSGGTDKATALEFRLAPTAVGGRPAITRRTLGKDEPVDKLYVSGEGLNGGAWISPTPYFPPLHHRPVPQGSLDAISAYSFLAYDERARIVYVKPGIWSVSGVISLPDGVGLTISGGTELQFDPEGALIVRGDTTFRGTSDAKIVFSGQGGRAWRGLAILNSDAKAHWEFVRIENTSGIDFHNWHLTGGVTIHQGHVVLTDTEFVGTEAEDALNLIGTRFRLTRVNVSHARLDAIDVDFGSGRIFGGVLTHVGLKGGGDGIDFCGAVASIEGTQFSKIGDKAISVGEASFVHTKRLYIHDALVGGASKDGSFLSVDGGIFRRIRLAHLMAYIKKKEYGAAVVDARNLGGKAGQYRVISQSGNLIRIDQETSDTVNLNVDGLYRTHMSEKAAK